MENNKKKIAIPIFTLVIAFALIWVVKVSFAVPTNNSIRISCDKTTLTVGEQANCRFIGTSSKVASITMNHSSTGLSISNVTRDTNNWNRDEIAGSFIYVSDTYDKTGTFNIASFKITATTAGTGKITTSNVIYYDDADQASVADATLNIAVKNPTPTPTPTTTQPTKTKTQTKSSNNYLSSLSLSKGSIAFSKTKTSYSVTVGNDVSSVRVSAKLAHSKASFAAGYNPRTVNLGYGKNTVKIIAVAENGAKRTYTIYITRSKGGNSKATSKSGSSKTGSKSSKSSSSNSSNNKLKTLYLSDGIINFKNNKYAYDVEVNNGVDVITVEGETENSKAKVKGLGKHDLKVGANTIKVVVTAENGDEKTYTLRITRKSKDSSEDLDSNNYLKDLSIAGYEFDFSKNKEDYDINRDGRESLKIKAVTESKNAKVTIQGNERLADGDEIQVIVTAEDGSNRTYTITVHDSNNIMYTAIGIFIIGLLSVIVVIAYKNKKANEE